MFLLSFLFQLTVLMGLLIKLLQEINMALKLHTHVFLSKFISPSGYFYGVHCMSEITVLGIVEHCFVFVNSLN